MSVAWNKVFGTFLPLTSLIIILLRYISRGLHKSAKIAYCIHRGNMLGVEMSAILRAL